MKSFLSVCAALSLASWIAACSVYMEATRPSPVDLSDYPAGTGRDTVLEKQGPPYNTATESDGASCDFYKLYTRGYGAGGKVPIAVTEAAADVFTLGLAEFILTPTEGMTRNEKHPVAFCYTDQKLVRVTFEGMQPTASATPTATPITSGGAGPVTMPSLTPSPSPTPQPNPSSTASQGSDR